ncbi:translation initiation factor IF3-1, mitochondrial-like [Cucurbita pepo subsp. pepo]|uniref:translation initiation factor IF3-1, mitochondrial-like n=1 Tax=Cucurbita pepo subsp. pepo TaxID=3664 RepID=UPI000C9DA49F|nr:translation initiation factor IF3-1, mitochondrial-like [Cucurbita pepo subsp. pepo]
MAFLCRINQSKLTHFSNQFKRHYFHICYASSIDSGRTTKHVSEYIARIIPRGPADFGGKVRFYAAPVQFQGKAKKEENNTSGPRLNDKIKAEFVRLVSDDGHAIVSLREALGRARELKLDLVEVQQKANPPVCKIMDFHREKYKQQIREKDRVKSKAEVGLRKGDHKEVRFTGKTEEKDLRMKADMVKRLMERGYRVKCSARGGEDQDLGGLLSRLSALIEDVAMVESGPRVERGQAYVIVRHVKFGPSKKGGGGKASKVAVNARQEVKNGTTPPVPAARSSTPDEEEMGPEESDSEATWSVVDGNNDFDEVFDLKDDANGIPLETTANKMNVASDRDVNVSDLSPPSRLPGTSRTSSVPLSRQDSSTKADNRYKKIEPANRFQPPNVMDNKGRGARDSLRSEPQIRNQWRQPLTNTNLSPPSMRETRPDDNVSSASRNTTYPSNETSKSGSSQHTVPDPSKTSFGIFSALNANAPVKQDAASTSYRGNRGPSTNPNAPGASESLKFSLTKSDDNVNKGQKSWGIFSEGPNNSPNRISKPN